MKGHFEGDVMGKPDLEELRHLFLTMLGERAPHVVDDLFEIGSAEKWAKKYGINAADKKEIKDTGWNWIIDTAKRALDLPIQKRERVESVIVAGRRRGSVIYRQRSRSDIWKDACDFLRFEIKPPSLEIQIFADNETYHYLTKEEFDRRVKKIADEYYSQWFPSEKWFDLKGARVEKQHCKWLVLFIGCKTDAQIAKAEKLDFNEDTVKKGRQRFAERIGLTVKKRGHTQGKKG